MTGPFLYDDAGRIVAPLAGNEPPPAVPVKFCAHGFSVFGCPICLHHHVNNPVGVDGDGLCLRRGK